MKTLMLVALAFVVTAASASSPVFAGQDNAPGKPTIAKMFVLNRDKAESIPVTVQGSAQVLPVEVVGAPTVAFAATAVVGTRQARQAWEYRQVVVAAGQDAAATLNALGLEGWEAVGAASASANNSLWMLKRPR